MQRRLILPGELPDLNQIIDLSKKHWAKYHVKKRRYTEAIAALAKATRMTPVVEYPVVIETTWFCKDRRRDPDNIAHAKKYILDGLTVAGILRGDGFKDISAFVDTFEVDAANPRVEVSIVENVAKM